ncbi:uncharacterized protein PV09_03206 [Verruconis gallopava]|uniref:BTB domain-containing protein n=1 Tax=Verruconis gallopava TaxID=253628 RepID=A0A0D1YZC7_9PEZI|nr:uncharacterized protein PV09_03206 [Verruconis gallopava]KIW06027.1 hypothetical protein PV09_03206 [Verruconis gallopava]
MTSHPAAAGILATVENAFQSGVFSDLTIQCHGHVFKVHKLVVCGQSEWFAKAVKQDGFQEGQTNVINLPFDDPLVVKALLQYLYTFDYTVPEDLEASIVCSQARTLQKKTPARSQSGDTERQEQHHGQDDSVVGQTSPSLTYGTDTDLTGAAVEPSALGIGSYRPESHVHYLWRMYRRSLRPRMDAEDEFGENVDDASTAKIEASRAEYDDRALLTMLFHVNVYALADRVQNKPLKMLAEQRFEKLAKNQWKSPDFPAVVQAIYDVVPPGREGDSLRNMIVRLVVSHAKELFSLDRGFTAMLQVTPDFGTDLARALSGAGVSTKGPEANVDLEELCCRQCMFTMKTILKPAMSILTCPLCRWHGNVEVWRNGSKE